MWWWRARVLLFHVYSAVRVSCLSSNACLLHASERVRRFAYGEKKRGEDKDGVGHDYDLEDSTGGGSGGGSGGRGGFGGGSTLEAASRVEELQLRATRLTMACVFTATPVYCTYK